jgi:tetratricopeptide (TPR) repeat protein
MKIAVVMWTTALVASAGVVSAPRALAQTAALKEAREHYRRGKDAYATQHFDEAYREFEAGYLLSARPLFLLNMGHAKRRAGQPAEARALFRQFLQLQPDSPHRAEVEAILRELAPPPALTPPPEPPRPVVVAPARPLPPSLPPPPPPSPAVMVAPAQPPAQPRSSRWWLWAGAGGALVAGAAVAFFARGRDPYTKQGSLGTLGNP